MSKVQSLSWVTIKLGMPSSSIAAQTLDFWTLDCLSVPGVHCVHVHLAGSQSQEQFP